jgi:23S rRNA G2445 N2-methylase RlmL
LQLDQNEIKYPDSRPNKIDVVFMSPPWGGTGYNLLQEYTLDLVYPDFSDLMKKSLQFSKNIILFLPRNTSINDLIEKLVPFCNEIVQDEKNH